MGDSMRFGEVLEAVDRLPLEDQETLVMILHRRLAEQGRKRVTADVREASQEFSVGGCQPISADELMDEILS